MKGWGALLLCVLGCTPDAGPDHARLPCRVVTRAEAELVTPARRVLTLTDEPEAWSVVAPSRAVVDGRLRLTASRGGPAISVARTGDVDLAEVGAIEVRAGMLGEGALEVQLLSAGEVVGRTASKSIDGAHDGAISLPLQRSSELATDIDELRLRFTGEQRRMDFESLVLVPDFDLSALPDADDGPLPMLQGTAWRPGLAVTTERVLEADVVPGPQSELTFAFGVPLQIVRRGRERRDELRVSVVEGDDVLDQRRFLLQTGSRDDRIWTDVRWHLGRFAGRDLTLRFEALAAQEHEPAACAVTPPTVGRPRDDAPTVLLITSDTHRADHLAAAPGSVTVATPNLDALAARGVLFADCYSPTNVTGPAHQALMTGIHPRDLGPVANGYSLPSMIPTLAEAYAGEGYATLSVVSAKHLGHRASGLARGFDRQDRPKANQREAAPSIARLVSWLDELRGRPVFVWLHLFDAHAPYDPPDAFATSYYPADRDPFGDDHGHPGPIEPKDHPGLRDMSFARAQYAAEVTGLDDALGPLLSRSRVHQGVVALVGDHGEGLGEGRVHFGHAELYPETVAVPCVLAWPQAPAGQVRDTAVTSLDLGRTLLDLSGLEGVAFPGKDLRRVDGRAPRFQLSDNRYSASIRDGRWYLVLHLTDHHTLSVTRGYERHEVELFDLAEDPEAKHDVLDDERAVARRLASALVDWLASAVVAGDGGGVPDAETTAMLLDLGYVGGTSDGGLWEPDDCAHCRALEGDG